MKESYTPPKLTVYGNVEKITQAVGDSPDNDFFIITGIPIGNGETIDAQADGPGGSQNFSSPFIPSS